MHGVLVPTSARYPACSDAQIQRGDGSGRADYSSKRGSPLNRREPFHPASRAECHHRAPQRAHCARSRHWRAPLHRRSGSRCRSWSGKMSWHGRWRQWASNTASVASVAASGTDAAGEALGSAEDIGRDTDARSQANMVPVRPQPVITSSAINSVPERLGDASLARSSTHAGYISMPPAPSTSGSTMRAAALPVAGHAPRSGPACPARDLAAGKGDRVDLEQQWLVGCVEHAAGADAHRANGVTMVAVKSMTTIRERAAPLLRWKPSAIFDAPPSTLVDPLSE